MVVRIGGFQVFYIYIGAEASRMMCMRVGGERKCEPLSHLEENFQLMEQLFEDLDQIRNVLFRGKNAQINILVEKWET